MAPVTPTPPPGERGSPTATRPGGLKRWRAAREEGRRGSQPGSARSHPDFLAPACVGGKDREAFEAEYRLGPLLGKGGFGTVFAGHRVTDRLQVSTTRVLGGSGVCVCVRGGGGSPGAPESRGWDAD